MAASKAPRGLPPSGCRAKDSVVPGQLGQGTVPCPSPLSHTCRGREFVFLPMFRHLLCKTCHGLCFSFEDPFPLFHINRQSVPRSDLRTFLLQRQGDVRYRFASGGAEDVPTQSPKSVWSEVQKAAYSASSSGPYSLSESVSTM